jgi:hypothetical protein
MWRNKLSIVGKVSTRKTLPQHLPEFGLRAQPAPQLAKELAAALLDLINQKGQEQKPREHRCQVLLPVPVVVLEVIALVL